MPTKDDLLRMEQPALIKLIDSGELRFERYGEWKKHYKSGFKVSNGYVSSCCDMWSERRSGYCPHCGAKMDGGRK